MKSLIWGIVAVLGALWSLGAWLLHGVAGAAGPAVVAVTRWLELEPSSTQWLADGLGAAGGLAQVLVIIGWALGMGALGLFGWMGTHATDTVRDMADEMRRDARVRGAGPMGGGPVHDGEVTARRIERAPELPRDPPGAG